MPQIDGNSPSAQHTYQGKEVALVKVKKVEVVKPTGYSSGG
jgi:hypothetical protein